MLQRLLVTVALSLTAAASACAAPVITRLTPPSLLDGKGEPIAPVVARFLPGQRFDLRVEATPDPGTRIVETRFLVDGKIVPPRAVREIGNHRAYSRETPGMHVLTAIVTQSDGQTASRKGWFEIVPLHAGKKRARNVILMIGDGMGIAHRTAARLMLRGSQMGKTRGLLEMDSLPVTGIVMTASLNSIVTDSSPGASCYATGNKANNNQQGVFPDDTSVAAGGRDGSANFDNPRVESIGEYLHRTQGKSLGIVTTADVFDATPGAFASHSQQRSAGTGIVDQFFDERGRTGLSVLMGGGRKWFLPRSTAGSARGSGSDYVLPADLASAWGVERGALDEERDLIADFRRDGWVYAADRSAMEAVPTGTTKLLGLFSLSNMNVAKDKIDGRRGASNIVEEYGFPDQPMLDEMASKALEVLGKNDKGFVLMVEGASIDKQAHNMDSERWILDAIEFDRAVGVARAFAEKRDDTLVIVTADHECGGVNVIGASKVGNDDLKARAASGGGVQALRDGVVGVYEAAGFPLYTIGADGYPVSTDIDNKLLLGYAANADRYEDWLTNPRPLRDSQQPMADRLPLSAYPANARQRDVAGGFLITGQVSEPVAVHTGSDIVLNAMGPGAGSFTGVMDNTDVFFRILQAVVGGTKD